MAFQQNAFQHNAFQVGIAGAAPPATIPAGTPSGGQWLNPWKKTPTIVFEQQDLLLTTLAPNIIIRVALFATQKRVVPTLSFEYNNLLPTLLAATPQNLPEGRQEYPDKLWKFSPTIVFEDQDKHLTLFNPGFPIGSQSIPDKFWKYNPTIVFEPQDLLTTLLFQAVVFPVGTQHFDAVLQKYKTQIVWNEQDLYLTLFNPGFPPGEQYFQEKLPKFQTSTYFEYHDLLNTVLIPPVVGNAPTLYYDITTGRMALLLIDTTTPKIIMLL